MEQNRQAKYEWREYRNAGVSLLLRDGQFVGEVRLSGPDGWIGTTMETSEATGVTRESGWFKHAASNHAEAAALTEMAAKKHFGDSVEIDAPNASEVAI
jgi:hypothetical protein